MVTPGFYYWKTKYHIGPAEQQTINSLRVQRMYVRLFDIDWDEQTHRHTPLAPAILPRVMDTSLQYVPVVFITQKALQHLTAEETTVFAKHLCAFVADMCSGAGIAPVELQLDCDWTEGTRTVYFRLLEEVKKHSILAGKTLSCTIRLHQVKFVASSGIPPADRGMLMCYSMGNMKKYGPVNSILDVGEAKRYMAILNKYPLPLDVALPIYRWCVLFHNKQFIGILHDAMPEMVEHSGLFRKGSGNMYTCLRDTLWSGYTLGAGDELRCESVSATDLRDIANYTAHKLVTNRLNVTLFSCDSITLSKYATDELEKIYDSYR